MLLLVTLKRMKRLLTTFVSTAVLPQLLLLRSLLLLALLAGVDINAFARSIMRFYKER